MGFLPDAERIISASFDARKTWKKIEVEIHLFAIWKEKGQSLEVAGIFWAR